jgi:hypothetical protein
MRLPLFCILSAWSRYLSSHLHFKLSVDNSVNNLFIQALCLSRSAQ